MLTFRAMRECAANRRAPALAQRYFMLHFMSDDMHVFIWAFMSESTFTR